MVFIAFMATDHLDEVAAESGRVFLRLAWESAPALLLAYVAAGLVYGLMPKASLLWMGRGSGLSQALRGMGFGLPLPICSCGVVPVYRSLIAQGVPVSAAVSFLVGTPVGGLGAVLGHCQPRVAGIAEDMLVRGPGGHMAVVGGDTEEAVASAAAAATALWGWWQGSCGQLCTT